MKDKLLYFKNITKWQLFVLFAVLMIVIVVVKFFSTQKVQQLVRVEVTGREQWWYGGNNPSNWLANSFDIGDSELDPDGSEVAKIIEIDSYPQGDEKYRIYLLIELSGYYDKRSDALTFKGKPVLIGDNIEINFKDSKMVGLVTHIGEKSILKKERYTATLLARNVNPWVFEKIQPGMKATNKGNNLAIAEFTEVKRENPSVKYLTSIYGNMLGLMNDSERKDLVFEAILTLDNDDGVLLYAGHQKAMVGKNLWIYTDSIDLDNVEIMSLEKLDEN